MQDIKSKIIDLVNDTPDDVLDALYQYIRVLRYDNMETLAWLKESAATWREDADNHEKWCEAINDL